MEQSENEKTNLNGKFSTVAVKQNQTVDSKKEHNKNEDTQNYVDEKDSDVVDYYEKYGIDRDEKWETIKEKLKKEQKKWMKRSSSTNEKEVLDEVFQQIDEISEVLALFKPGNEEKRKQYDAKLDEQKQRQVSDDNVKEEKSKIGLEGIGVSIRNNPTSLEHLREIQQQMASQIKTREKNRNSMQPKSTNQTEIDDIEK